MFLLLMHQSIYQIYLFTLCNGVCGKTFKTMQKKMILFFTRFIWRGRVTYKCWYLLIRTYVLLAVLFQHRHYICTYYESTKNIKLKIIRIGNLIHKLCLIMSIVNTLNNISNFLKIFGKILHPSLLKTKVAL